MTVIGASLAVGIYLSHRLNERTKILGSFIALLEEVSVRMTYTSDNLAGLFAQNFAGWQFDEHQPFDRQFCRMTRKYQNVLRTEDLVILDDLASGLGASDADSQLRRIGMYRTLLNEKLEESREEVKRRGKLCLILPLSIGIAAAILLF